MMMCDLIVRVPVLGTDYARHSRMATCATIFFNLDSVCHAARDVPSRWKRHRGSRTRGYATALGARRARIELASLSRFIDQLIDQNRRAKRHPGSELRMNENPQDARPRQPRGLPQLDEIQGRLSSHEWKYDRVSRPGFANPGCNLILHDAAREIVKRMIAFHPVRILLGVPLERSPQAAAAIRDDDDRFRMRIDRRGSILLRDCRVVAINRHCGDQVEPKGLSRGANSVDDGGHRTTRSCRSPARPPRAHHSNREFPRSRSPRACCDGARSRARANRSESPFRCSLPSSR